MVTQERLKALFDYDPDTGVFRWAVNKGPAKAGSVAGYQHHLGYICIRVDGVKHQAHRLAVLYMTGKWPGHDVDHVNHIRNDNRWSNLRPATRSENARNASRYATNSTGQHGVSWRARDGKWLARITVYGESIYLGMHDTFEDAVAARKLAEVHHGFHENHGKSSA